MYPYVEKLEEPKILSCYYFFSFIDREIKKNFDTLLIPRYATCSLNFLMSISVLPACLCVHQVCAQCPQLLEVSGQIPWD